jgi:hypothetical protein
MHLYLIDYVVDAEHRPGLTLGCLAFIARMHEAGLTHDGAAYADFDLRRVDGRLWSSTTRTASPI